MAEAEVVVALEGRALEVALELGVR